MGVGGGGGGSVKRENQRWGVMYPRVMCRRQEASTPVSISVFYVHSSTGTWAPPGWIKHKTPSNESLINKRNNGDSAPSEVARGSLIKAALFRKTAVGRLVGKPAEGRERKIPDWERRTHVAAQYKAHMFYHLS